MDKCHLKEKLITIIKLRYKVSALCKNELLIFFHYLENLNRGNEILKFHFVQFLAAVKKLLSQIGSKIHFGNLKSIR